MSLYSRSYHIIKQLDPNLKKNNSNKEHKTAGLAKKFIRVLL